MDDASRPARWRIGRVWAFGAPVVVVFAVLVSAGTCARATDPAPTAVPLADVVPIPVDDDVLLDGRLFEADADRLVIFLHAFDGSQVDWWPLAEEVVSRGWASALTFDFRGYGASEGEFQPDTLVPDILATVRFARGEGFDSIVLVGASMGGTAAIVAAAEEPAIEGVVTVSAPVAFGDLETEDALAALRAQDERPTFVLLAARDDVSATDSLRQIRDSLHEAIPQARVFAGTAAHGTDLLEAREAPEARHYLLDQLSDMWE